MNEPKVFRASAAWRRALLPVAVAVAAIMVLLSVIEAAKSARRLPPQVGFIPVESSFLAVTSSLDGFWRNLGNHATRLRDPAPDSYWADVNSSLRELSTHCLAMETAEDLSAAGFDPARGLSVALMGDRPDMLLTIPVLDSDRALETLGALFVPAVPVALSPPSSNADVVKYILAPDRLENAQLCVVPTGTPFQGRPRLLGIGLEHDIVTEPGADPSVELYFAPNGSGRARMELRCEAVLRDGTSQPCNCVIDYEAPCDRPFDLDSGDPALRPLNDPPPNSSGEMAV